MRLECGDGLGLSVPVSLLVADSLLVREVLRGHEAGQERIITLAQVEGDTLRQYSEILRTGSIVMRTGDRCWTSIIILIKLKLCLIGGGKRNQ